MRPPKNFWTVSEDGRCVLLCAQLFQEMLGEFTFESFRVYSLDTLSRLNEAIELIGDIQSGRLPQAALEPVIEEMIWSFKKDPIAETKAQLEIDALRVLVKEKYSLPDVLSNIRLIRRLLSWGYKVAIEERLLQLFDEPKRKIEMRQACGFYCSYLINIGFSRQWIAEQVNETFFTHDMSNVDRATLSSFFGKFAEDPSNFVVHALIGTELATFLRPFGYKIFPLDRSDQNVQANFKSYSVDELALIIQTKETAYDDYGAVSSFQQKLTSIRALTYLQPDPIACRWGESMYVEKEEGVPGRTLRSPVLSFEKPPEKKMTGRRLRSHRAYFGRVFEDFDARSTERLLSSINTAALARTSPNRENQLISMWSAIEVLLSDPPVGTARIVSYTRQLIPCVCLRHVRRQFVAVFEELLVIYRRGFLDILKREPEFSKTDSHTSLAAVLCLDENEGLQKDLCKLLENNPLALQRVFKLRRDYQTPAEVAHTLMGHRSRVEWQINRIYRARNQLVHAGDVPSYLDSLILNLAEYYRASIATIINRARRDPNNSDIDQVVSEISIEYGIFTRHFPKSDQNGLNRDSLYRLMSTAAV